MGQSLFCIPTPHPSGVSPLPFIKELRIRQGTCHNPCSLSRGVGPCDSHDLLHLGKDPQDAIWLFGNHCQIPHTLIWKEGQESALGVWWGWGQGSRAVMQESTHCRARSSWRRTGHRRARTLQTQNSEWPRRLSPGCQMQSPDRPSQRRGTETGAARKESESGQEMLLGLTSDIGLPSPTGAWKERLILSIPPTSFLSVSNSTLHLFLCSPK